MPKQLFPPQMVTVTEFAANAAAAAVIIIIMIITIWTATLRDLG